MGYWSEKQLENDAHYAWAQSFLAEVGVLEECENHSGTFFEGYENIENAYRLANSQITSGEMILEDGETREDRTTFLKEVYEDNSGVDGCQECARNFGPD